MVDSMTARCPAPVASKQAQIISPPSPWFTVSVRCLCWFAVFSINQMRCCPLWPNIQRTEVLRFDQMRIYQSMLSTMFSPGITNRPYMFCLFQFVLSWIWICYNIPTSIGSQIVANVFPTWHCVNTHLNGPD